MCLIQWAMIHWWWFLYGLWNELNVEGLQFYEALEGTTRSEAIDLVIQTCRRTVTYGGLFFLVQELEVSSIQKLIKQLI